MSEMLQDLRTVLDIWNGAVSAVQAVILSVMALVALLECFFGFKLIKLAFAVCGFLLGGVVGFAVGALALGAPTAGVVTAAVLIGGIVGAVLLFRIYLLGVFLSNALLTLLLFLLLGAEPPALLLGAVCGIVVGVLSVKFVRVWMIFSTGIAGGTLAGRSLITLLIGAHPFLSALLGLMLSTLGILFQWKTTASAAKKSPAAPAFVPEPETDLPETDVPRSVHPQPSAKRKYVLAGAGISLTVLAVGTMAGFTGTAEAAPVVADTAEVSDNEDMAEFSLDQVKDYAEGETTALTLVEQGVTRYLFDQDGEIIAQGDGLYFAGEIDGEPCAHDRYTGDVYDAQGRVRFNTKDISYGLNELGGFSEGLCPAYRQAAYQMHNGERGALEPSGWIVLDIEGNVVLTLDTQYDRVDTFLNGHAVVRQAADGFGFRFGLIDRTGNPVVPCQYASLSYAPDQTTLIAQAEDGAYGALDLQGGEVEPFVHDSADEVLQALGMETENT